MRQLKVSSSSLFAYIALLGANFIYACTSIFTKMASMQAVMSWRYLMWTAGAVGIMGIYALIWQQIIARLPLSVAYMFKGTSVIYVLLFSALLFGEAITITNIIGSMIIILGIVFYAKT